MKYFSGLTTEGMKTYIKSPPKRDPNNVIIHAGTNKIRSAPETIAKNVVAITKNSKNDKNEISSIVQCCDNLNVKACRVNKPSEKLCVKNNFNSYIWATVILNLGNFGTMLVFM